MTTLTPPYTHLHKSPHRILRVLPILIAATLFCSCTDDSKKEESCTQDKCEGWCGDLQTDAQHCGNCETDCTVYEGVTGTCSEGKCVFTAALCKDETDSSGNVTQRKKICIKDGNPVCADIDNDPNNCGECGEQCDQDKTSCIRGKCTPKSKCPDEVNYLRCHFNAETQQYETAGESETDFECLSIQNDSRYCGWKSCENNEHIESCTEQQSCKDGTCKSFEATCDGTNSLTCKTDDDIKCINKAGESTCGAKSCDKDGLGKACEGDLVCLNTNGDCGCPDGLVQSGNTCIDPNDNETCGATKENPNGEDCAENNRYCHHGTCLCAPPLVECGGTCIDPMTDNTYCGANAQCDESSYNSCAESNMKCSEGECVCKNDNEAYCEGECVNNSWKRYCGARGKCNSNDPNSNNFRGYNCTVGDKCVQINQDEEVKFSCQCYGTDIYDPKSGKCIKISSDAEACGEKMVNCKLRFGEEATCYNGKCECPHNWLTIENDDNGNTVGWYHDSEHPYICIDTLFDSRYCGASIESKGMNCEENNQMCIDGVCVNIDDADDITCYKGGGTTLCNDIKACFYFNHRNTSSCSECKDNRCIMNGQTLVYDGCQGVVGVHCDCDKASKYEVKIDGAYQCVSIETDKLNIEKCSDGDKTCTDEFKCKSGWANPDLEKLNSDKSFGAEDVLPGTVGAVGCNIPLDTLDNCGSVGTSCALHKDDKMHYANAACNNGQCAYTCEGSYRDCNPDIPGCEVDIMNNPNKNGICGTCNNTCAGDKICQNGKCCYGEGTIHDGVKSSNCCNGLSKYRKCAGSYLGVCIDYEYQCAAGAPDANWEKI